MNRNNSTIDNDFQLMEIIEKLIPSMEEWYHKWIVEDGLKHKIDGHNFNIFSLWNNISKILEPMHSRILQFILSDNEMHGQGNKFLMKFLERLEVPYSEIGEWEIVAEEGDSGGRADILIKREKPFNVIIIENKSNNAYDMEGQLYRYWYQNIHKRENIETSPSIDDERNKNSRIIYLAPNECKFYAEQSCKKPPYKLKWFKNLDCESYNKLPDTIPLRPHIWTFNNHIQSWLEDCIRLLDESNHPIRQFLKQYKNFCSNLNKSK